MFAVIQPAPVQVQSTPPNIEHHHPDNPLFLLSMLCHHSQMNRAWLLGAILLGIVSCVSATHVAYGSYYWTRDATTPTKFTLTAEYAFRRSYFSKTLVAGQTVNAGSFVIYRRLLTASPVRDPWTTDTRLTSVTAYIVAKEVSAARLSVWSFHAFPVLSN